MSNLLIISITLIIVFFLFFYFKNKNVKVNPLNNEDVIKGLESKIDNLEKDIIKKDEIIDDLLERQKSNDIRERYVLSLENTIRELKKKYE